MGTSNEYPQHTFSSNGTVRIIQAAHDKTTIRCVTIKDSDQPVQPPSMARVFVLPSLNSPEALKGTYNQQRLIRLCKWAG